MCIIRYLNVLGSAVFLAVSVCSNCYMHIHTKKKMSLEICYCDKEDIVMKYMHKIIERKFVSLNGLPPTCSGGI